MTYSDSLWRLEELLAEHLGYRGYSHIQDASELVRGFRDAASDKTRFMQDSHLYNLGRRLYEKAAEGKKLSAMHGEITEFAKGILDSGKMPCPPGASEPYSDGYELGVLVH